MRKIANCIALALALLFCGGCMAPQDSKAPIRNQPVASTTPIADADREVSMPIADEVAKKEYLTITTTAYANGENDANGVNLVLYSYCLEDETLQSVFDMRTESVYPANTIDYKNQLVYFANGKLDDGYDNLFQYDMATGETKQLTDGKYSFDDMLWVDGKLYVNAAREYATVCQPAIFDFENLKFTYLNEEDDDTWHYSFSYNYATHQFLIMTCSDAEMRTERVAGETHIRPKTISTLDTNLEHKSSLFFTEDFEIRLTRQLDANHILMTADPYMGGGPRKLKLLTVNTQTVEPFEIPNIDMVYLCYPALDGNTLFFIGKKNDDTNWNVYRYQIQTGELTNIFEGSGLSDNIRTIVDIQCTVQ